MMGHGNYVHPTAVISPDANIGEGNHFGPYVVVRGDVTIGNQNRFESHCSIGTAAEHHEEFWKEPRNGVIIGSCNVFREFVTVNCGTNSETQVGWNNVILRGAHISHDTIVEDCCTISCNVLIGGHSRIMKFANLGLGSILHQFSVVGTGAMLGMGTVVPKKRKIEPFRIYVGNPATYLKANIIGTQKAKLSTIDMAKEVERYQSLL